ncbi:MAG TPA: phosphoribosylformylglycinamidine cyclo-ligase [Gemmatimonas aurantiaca]|uniref:Phosphoribosylformylglycinamidine cyclo-ligase n=2 Tax=Gemmatimonas aurantiaca TaxID=173480 RepID=C1A8F1_GEMAT|nr:phosphoribosylformylglycinamidine cyclo-ligase [Gemmatimonas aurantiaca]BAH38511.1 phosphoribosylformylglycinamidine cyclo-ligase [Gemmatimonas aurantiaca T-27]HCT56162.1 phosphoribosylformylglycinamidine cyclo-ligase [Gemmatimonas aurantiaca]
MTPFRNKPLDYRSAGVDIDAADDAKNRLAKLVQSTMTAGSRGAFGGFGGMFRVPDRYRAPLLVASADGVGTKIKIAIEADRHDTIGHCLVNHCTNDILVQGAVPLYFLDYVAFGKLEPAVVEGVVAGVAAGCRENLCALIGGETAEMPGVYTPPDYDLAGFITGIVEEDQVLSSVRVEEGDVLVALASDGLHTNGYSLARRIISDRLNLGVHDLFPDADGASVADVMLKVHRSYLTCLQPLLGSIHAMAHITGGGLPGNLNRALPHTLDAVVDTSTWTIPSVFRVLAEAGQVSPMEMFRAFNMGVGMVVITARENVSALISRAAACSIDAWELGSVEKGSGEVQLRGLGA